MPEGQRQGSHHTTPGCASVHQAEGRLQRGLGACVGLQRPPSSRRACSPRLWFSAGKGGGPSGSPGANEAKRDILGVNYDDIVRYGAVSEQVARQMAEGVRRATGADYAISTTGIAGPSGGSAEKPVGTVWMAVATPTHTVAMMRPSGTDRGQIINRASAYAIEMLYKELKKE